MNTRFRQGVMDWGSWEEGVLFLWGNSLCKGRKAEKPGWGRKENRIISIRVERKALNLGALAFEDKSTGIQEP